MKPLTPHPDWCAADHQCTARLPSGSHASHPQVWRGPYGRLVAVRRQAVAGGRDWLEVTTSMRLSGSPEHRRETARALVASAHFAAAGVLEAARPRA